MPHGLTWMSLLVIRPRRRHGWSDSPCPGEAAWTMPIHKPPIAISSICGHRVRDYHSLLSDYLTANSIFVAAIGLLLARQPLTLIFTLLVIILCLFGVLMTLQMAIVLGRFSAQTSLWEWQDRKSVV